MLMSLSICLSKNKICLSKIFAPHILPKQKYNYLILNLFVILPKQISFA